MAKKKTFAPGTFLPFPKRLLAILQLCISFSLILWHMAQPFMGEYFTLRSRMLLYEYAMGTSNVFNASKTEKLERNAQRWGSLPSLEQKKLLDDYKLLQEHAKRSFGIKIKESFQLLLTQLPPFELAWLVFSIAIALLLLLKREGARQAAWLLPAITLIYAIDNHMHGQTPKSSPDHQLFPSESLIVERYVKGGLSPRLEEQRQQLEQGWNAYLIERWLPLNPLVTGLQALEEAEFQFTRARLHQLHGTEIQEWKSMLSARLSPLLLLLYFIWNLFFARVLSYKMNN